MNNTFTSVEIEGMSYEEFSAEYGECPTQEALVRRFPQYSDDPDSAWEALEQENEESLARWLATGRQS